MHLGDPLTIELPTSAGPRTYEVPPITAAQFWSLRTDNAWHPIAVTRTATPAEIVSAALTDSVLDEMLAGDVLDAHVQLSGAAAMAWHSTGDPAAAEPVWTGNVPDLRPVTADELDRYGVGPQNANGDYLEYDLPPDVEARLNRKPNDGLTLGQVWAHADAIACDLLAEYRIDVAGPIMRRRSGPWLRRLVDGLLMADTRLARLLYAETKPKGGSNAEHTQG